MRAHGILRLVIVALPMAGAGCSSPSAPPPVIEPPPRSPQGPARPTPSDTEVLVDGGYYYNGISASGNTYRVRFQGGDWVVVDVRRRWIS